ncbi:hpr kinase phosphatase [Leptolyngbya sp. Heron Island J]|uniref:hpr kinase phosphatase n=1 Tax=Leptolyngbya sp. Heron Island J TaxID=1385935 RepID=UPI0003B9A6B1|nr:hpr kinase phosphatase [Leptolyngbya sp. Heron Island J]ESA34078.1 hpr kinase phosphatase [Leptolyngbya sp. Heron Island J]
MYSYSAYQLCLHSEIPLSGLPVADGEPDIIVRLKPTDNHSNGETNKPTSEVFGRLEGIGDCWISDGRFITIAPFDGVTHEMLSPNILGGCMSIILRQRGFLTLHASSVAIHGHVAAFLGHSGWGKSTLAAALHADGHTVITDDILAIDLKQEGTPQVVPSFPQCKLSPDAAIALGKDPADLAPLYAHAAKRAYNFQAGFQTEQLPLQRIYILSKGDRHSITPLNPKETFAYLVSHTRAMNVLRDNESLQTHFQQCTQLLQQVSYYRFTRKPGLAELPDLVRMVEEHMKETSVETPRVTLPCNLVKQ